MESIAKILGKRLHSLHWIKSRKFLIPLAGLTLGVALALLQWDGLEQPLRRAFQGPMIPAALRPAASPEIVLIAIDDHTLKATGERPELSWPTVLRFLHRMNDTYMPRALAFTDPLSQIAQDPESISTDIFAALAQEIEAFDSNARPLVFAAALQNGQEVAFPGQLTSLITLKTRLNLWDAESALSHWNGTPSLSLELAQSLGYLPPDYVPQSSQTDVATQATTYQFRYRQDLRLDPLNRDFHSPRGPYRIVPFVDVLEGETAPELLKDKVAIVGTLLHDRPTDFIVTPFNRKALEVPKLLVQATIFDSLIKRDSIRLLPTWTNIAISSLLGTLGILIALMASPGWSVLLALAVLTVVFAFSLLLFLSTGLWLRLTEPALAVGISFYLGLPYRLFQEAQLRWELMEKNTMLKKVEDLKDHFLSLVTHDLKTPLARIQGLAEQLRGTAPAQSTAIVRATQDLNAFVTQLLELNKIETQGGAPLLKSKDPNTLLEALLDQPLYKDRIAEKGILIETQLSPLFPVPLDPAWTRQILANLLDNAIKYCPSGGLIRMTSEEREGSVLFHVQNSGPGINDDEKPHIFERFYRSPIQKERGVSGSGLGLYLSRYFATQMGGTLSFESSPQGPTVFTLQLPTQAHLRAGLKREMQAADSQKRSNEVIP